MRASDKTLAADNKMLAQDSDAVYYYQAITLNIKLIRQLVDDLPAYATPEWEIGTTKYIPKLDLGLAKLEKLHRVWYCELLDGTVDLHTLLHFIHDVRAPITMLQLYCQMLERLIPEQDAALFLLDAIKAYNLETREMVDALFYHLRAGL